MCNLIFYIIVLFYPKQNNRTSGDITVSGIVSKTHLMAN